MVPKFSFEIINWWAIRTVLAPTVMLGAAEAFWCFIYYFFVNRWPHISDVHVSITASRVLKCDCLPASAFPFSLVTSYSFTQLWQTVIWPAGSLFKHPNPVVSQTYLQANSKQVTTIWYPNNFRSSPQNTIIEPWNVLVSYLILCPLERSKVCHTISHTSK